MPKAPHNHGERIDVAIIATRAELAAALDAYRAEQAAKLDDVGPGGPTWPQLVQYLIDNPPWHSYNSASPASKLRALWSEFPVTTPFGDVLVSIQRTATDDREYGRSFELRIPTGGSFIVNGAQYAPAEGSFVTHTSINAEFVTSWDDRSAWVVRHTAAMGKRLTVAAANRVSEWIEAEGEDLVFTPARVIARELFDITTTANRAREARDKEYALAIAADADWNKAATDAHLILNAAVVIAGGNA